jgi:hypothetical protein
MTLRWSAIGGAAIAAWGLGCSSQANDLVGANGGQEARAGQAGMGSGGAHTPSGGRAGNEPSTGGSRSKPTESDPQLRAGSGGHAGDEVDEVNVRAGSGGAVTTEAKLTTSAWDVTISTTWTQPNSHAEAPRFEMTMALFDESMFHGLLSRDGSWLEFGLIRQGETSAAVATGGSPVQIWLLTPAPPSMALTLQSMTFTAFDDNGDGIADRLTGSGVGSIEEDCGDCALSYPVTVSLSGRPDQTPPRLNLSSEPLNPIDQFSVLTSEALKSASLLLSGSKTFALETYNQGMPLIGAGSSEVLPFSGSWKITGSGRDFAGLALDLSAASVSTIADPGVFAVDGFEGTLNATLTGDAAVVNVSSGLPIPSGQRALLLPPGSSATFHLKRGSTGKTVSARFVDLSDAHSGGPWARFQAAVIGGRRAETFSSTGPGTLTTTHPIWTRADPARSDQPPALQGTGADVVVRINAEFCSGGGPCPPTGALLVDDLKVE